MTRDIEINNRLAPCLCVCSLYQTNMNVSVFVGGAWSSCVHLSRGQGSSHGAGCSADTNTDQTASVSRQPSSRAHVSPLPRAACHHDQGEGAARADLVLGLRLRARPPASGGGGGRGRGGGGAQDLDRPHGGGTGENVSWFERNHLRKWRWNMILICNNNQLFLINFVHRITEN